MTAQEDYREKNAREGKAFYLPGKTVEEIEAGRVKAEERRAKHSARIVTLSEGEWDGVDTALPDVIELLNDVGNVFSMLAWTEDLDWPEFNSMMRMAARAVRSFEENELAVLDRLDTGIRQAKQGEK